MEIVAKKTKKLAFTKKLTGTVEIPFSVLRAKDIKEKTTTNEMIGHDAENESEFEEVSDAYDNLDPAATSKTLNASNLLDTSRDVKKSRSK